MTDNPDSFCKSSRENATRPKARTRINKCLCRANSAKLSGILGLIFHLHIVACDASFCKRNMKPKEAVLPRITPDHAEGKALIWCAPSLQQIAEIEAGNSL